MNTCWDNEAFGGSRIIVRARKARTGANATRYSDQSSTAVASTLRLPAIFLGGEKLVAPLIAAPNGQCATKGEDRREGQKARLRAMRVTLYVLLKGM